MAKAIHLSVCLTLALATASPSPAQDADTGAQQPSAPPPITDNQLKGLFTPQPQYPTPQSVMNPDARPPSLMPENLPQPPELPPPAPAPEAQTAPIALPPQAEEKDKEKEEAEERGEANKEEKTHLARTGGALPMTPLRLALVQLKMAHYDTSLKMIDKYLMTNPNDAQAHYLKGVALACTRQYPPALSEYKKVLTLSPDPRLAELAQTGIKKLER